MTPPACGAEGAEGHVCTRRPGHAGHHIAHGLWERVVATWPPSLDELRRSA